MKRLKRDGDAVSPVIATILMVAITVVLAASLWVMMDSEDDVDFELYGTLTRGDRNRDEGWMRIDIASMNPSSLDLRSVTVRLYDANDTMVCALEGVRGDREVFNDQGYSLAWSRVGEEGEEQIDSTSRLFVDYEEEGRYDFDGYGIVITAEGYGGHLGYDH